MHHFLKEMFTHVHISITKWWIVGYGTGAWGDFYDRPIENWELMSSNQHPSDGNYLCSENNYSFNK